MSRDITAKCLALLNQLVNAMKVIIVQKKKDVLLQLNMFAQSTITVLKEQLISIHVNLAIIN